MYFSHVKGGNSNQCSLFVENHINNLDDKRLDIDYELNESEIDDVYKNVYNDDVEDFEGLSDEQLAIINSLEKLVKVNAIFGSGKTFIIEKLIEKNIDKEIVYLVFTRAMRIEAQERFEKKFGKRCNVKVRTVHSMAYENFGAKYQDVLTTDLNIFDVAKAVGLFMKKSEDFKLIDEVKIILEHYLTTGYHSFDEYLIGENINVSYKHIMYADKLFNAMLKGKCKVTHNFYLKLWHLSKPDLSDFDMIAIDEFQDNSGALLDIVDRNSDNDSKIIVIGDTNQSIYQFNHSVNGLELLNKGWKNYPLTKSFRVGNTLAKVMETSFSRLLGTDLKIEGYNKTQKVVKSIDRDKKHWVISRYNSTIFRECIDYTQMGKKIYIHSTRANFDFKYLQNLYRFKFYGDKHFTFKKYKDYNEMVKEAEKTDNRSFLSMDKLMSEYGTSFIYKINDMKELTVDSPDKADVCYVTAHSSKGMTINDPVRLTTDFPDLLKPQDFDILPEINLFYVANSRCSGDIELPDSLLSMYLNDFESPITIRIDREFRKITNHEIKKLKSETNACTSEILY